jgi:CDP-diacylglycerol--glycerol-3-phosphate 3-phosphatidyltransferase
VDRKVGTGKAQPRKRWECLTDWARAQVAFVVMPTARVLARLGIHPNTVTIFGMMLQVGVAVVFGLGHIVLGGWLLMVVAPFDVVDGALARVLERQSRFGAFLDSTLDRISDSALILGLTAHYIGRAAYVEVGLLLVSLVSATLVSYVRARAEALGFPCKVGLLTRMERVALIAVLTAVGLSDVLVWVLALLSVFTVIQRVAYVYVAARQTEEGV